MKIKMVNKDLFSVNEKTDTYALAHCISSDFGMGAGIVVLFNKYYDMKNKLLSKYGKRHKEWTGDGYCIPCKVESAKGDDYTTTVFNLVTKQMYFHKPTYETLNHALIDMRLHMEAMNIDKVAMPLIGCGLDGLKWSRVKTTIEDVFGDSEIEVLICYLRQDKYLLSQ